MAEHVFTHQRAEDAANIGERVVTAAARIQQDVDPGIGGLEPAQPAGLGQQGFGPRRLGHQDMGIADQFLGFALVVGPKDAQMGQIGRLEQTLVVMVVLAEQKQGTLAHTLVPYHVYGRAMRVLLPSYPS